MKIFQCGRCGAPLEARWWRSRQRCNYCGATNEKEKLRTLHETKPKDFKPPKEWKPPPSADTHSSETLKYKGDPGVWVVYGIMGLVITVGLILGTSVAWWPLVHGIVPADLQKLDVIGSPDKIEAALQGADHDPPTFVRALFRTSSVSLGYYQATFSWDDNHLDAPKDIEIESFDKTGTAPAGQRLASHLHGGLDSGTWHYGTFVSLTFSSTHGDVILHVDPGSTESPNPNFHRQVQIGFALLLNAAFDLPVSMDPKEARDIFGAGYPVADLEKLDPATSLRDAASTVKKIFPGALAESSDNDSFVIALDHPIVVAVHLQWYEGTPMRLSRLGFDLAPGFPKKVDAFSACLASHFGKPNEVFTSYGKNEKRVEFQLGGAGSQQVELDFNTQDAVSTPEQGFPAAVWSTIFKTLDGCR